MKGGIFYNLQFSISNMNVQSSKLSLHMIEFVQVLKKIGYQYKFRAVQHETRNISSGVKLEMSYKKIEVRGGVLMLSIEQQVWVCGTTSTSRERLSGLAMLLAYGNFFLKWQIHLDAP